MVSGPLMGRLSRLTQRDALHSFCFDSFEFSFVLFVENLGAGEFVF